MKPQTGFVCAADGAELRSPFFFVSSWSVTFLVKMWVADLGLEVDVFFFHRNRAGYGSTTGMAR
jgi:hypothetical protein